VSASLTSYVRALEAARDAQTDPKAKQALAAVAATRRDLKRRLLQEQFNRCFLSILTWMLGWPAYS
jgi:hypothetical protein